MSIVCHLNIIAFKAAVAAVRDKSLRGRPYVIALAAGGRALALDCSPEAVRQGITPGTAIAIASRRVPDLTVLSPDPPSYKLINEELEKIVARYAPVWENDAAGNLYLDITGTSGLFGPPMDCSSRILGDIIEKTGIQPATAVACNKLVGKVATRSIRPTGLIQIRQGTEAEFLSHQDVRLLPGMGPKLLRTAAITGIREIGEIAALSIPEAISLFGKHGAVLRNMALGIDTTPVENSIGKKSIVQQADFNEDVIDNTAIRAAIETLCSFGGLKMRNEKLGTTAIRLCVTYSDSLEVRGLEKSKKVLVTDCEITDAALSVFKKTVIRRIRIRSVGISLEDFVSLSYQPDLFEPETENKKRKLQDAIDKIQNRYGEGKIKSGRSFLPANLPELRN